MKCEHCREWLNQYIDFELSEEESAWVEEHISACKSCRQEYNSLVRTKQASMSIPEYEPPHSFAAGWRNAVLADMQLEPEQLRPVAAASRTANKTAYPKPARSSGLQRIVRGVALAAAAVAIFAISVQAYNHFSATGDNENVARNPEATLQAKDSANQAATGGGNTDQQDSDLNHQEEQVAEPFSADVIPETQLPDETDTDFNLASNEAALRSEEDAIKPQSSETLDPPSTMESAELGGNDSDDANSAINGVKDVYFSAPIDRERIEEELEKHDVEYKYTEGMHVVTAYADNAKDVNQVLLALGSTETVLPGETLHIRLR